PGPLRGRAERPNRVRRPMARPGRPFGPRPEAARVLAIRSGGRSADDVAPGADRWSPELGLPLRLAARRHVEPRRPHEPRLPRRSDGIFLVVHARLAPAAAA